jgi:putative nucleotidyltransferase with HDIG domain
MADRHTEVIDVSRLRIGHFVFVDLSWISHPFPLNSFKIRSPEQIETIRSLGIDRIRYSPERSDPEPDPNDATAAAGTPETGARPAQAHVIDRSRRDHLTEHHASLKACEREYTTASREVRAIVESVRTRPAATLEAADALVAGMSVRLLGAGEICIRLLSERIGERASHEINVTVLSLLLGNACRLDELALQELGVGALLHDIGKIDLPDRLRYANESRSAAEEKLYQQHVAFGVALGRKIGLPAAAQKIIAQHHEHADGSGYPQRLASDALSQAARIVALVDRYDNLCNPGNPALAMTPHEALSQIFTQMSAHFDTAVLGTLIRMMGVYPPGSVVQLNDDRYALVISVNSQRPLKPRVIIHDPRIPREEALLVDLADHPETGIRRSLRPLQLPRATFDYLSPRTRICYFFERAGDTRDDGAGQ